MKFKKLTQILNDNKDAALHIMLPSGEFVPSHFHVTEVGLIRKSFIDCGGTVRQSDNCCLQLWTSDDTEHSLSAERLAKILRLGEQALSMEDLPVSIEYGADVASNYILSGVESTPSGLLLVLNGRQTDCLAPDKCGVSKCCAGKCC